MSDAGSHAFPGMVLSRTMLPERGLKDTTHITSGGDEYYDQQPQPIPSSTVMGSRDTSRGFGFNRPNGPRTIVNTAVNGNVEQGNIPADSFYRSKKEHLPGVKEILRSGCQVPQSPRLRTDYILAKDNEILFEYCIPRTFLNVPNVKRSHYTEDSICNAPWPTPSLTSPSPPLDQPGFSEAWYRDFRFSETQDSSICTTPTGCPPITSGQYSDHKRAPVDPLDSDARGASKHRRNYIGERMIPGSGLCHVYDNGHWCPTQIDGVNVNPHWGLTRAQKPRKRLPAACLLCRAKKIKCDPVENTCLQCRKNQQSCSNGARSVSLTNATHLPISRSTNALPLTGAPSQSAAIRGVNEPESCEKHSFPYDNSLSGVRVGSRRGTAPVQDTREYSDHVYHRLLGDSSHLNIASSMVDTSAIFSLVDLYIRHVNDSAYNLFPPGHLQHWVRNTSSTDAREQMVLSAILAVATVFAGEERQVFGKQCAENAQWLVVHNAGPPTLLDTQAWFLLAIYYNAKGSFNAAWRCLGSAARNCTSTRLQLSTEDGCRKFISGSAPSSHEFSFNQNQLIECRRRTFWSCFLMDRYMDPNQRSIQREDVFLRLPCSDKTYSKGLNSRAPFFDNGIVDISTSEFVSSDQNCDMAYLVQVADIWGVTMDFLTRVPRQHGPNQNDTYETIRAKTNNALQDWKGKLPTHLGWSQSNLSDSVNASYGGVYFSIHTLRLFTLMKLESQTRLLALTSGMEIHDMRSAQEHASTLLDLLFAVSSMRESRGMGTQDLVFIPTFMEYVVASSIHIWRARDGDAGDIAVIDWMQGDFIASK